MQNSFSCIDLLLQMGNFSWGPTYITISWKISSLAVPSNCMKKVRFART